jgi:hypothetical protein
MPTKVLVSVVGMAVTASLTLGRAAESVAQMQSSPTTSVPLKVPEQSSSPSVLANELSNKETTDIFVEEFAKTAAIPLVQAKLCRQTSPC